MEYNCGIYKITNILNDKIYIGSSKDIKGRKYMHFWMLSENRHHSLKLQNAYNKYGKENFIHKSIIDCLEKELKYYEDYYIGYYKPFYNSSDRAIGLHSLTDEQKQNIGNSIRGIKRSSETLEKMRQANLGKKSSEETKKKMTEGRNRYLFENADRYQMYDNQEDKYYKAESIQKLSNITNISRSKLQALYYDYPVSKKLRNRYSIKKISIK